MIDINDIINYNVYLYVISSLMFVISLVNDIMSSYHLTIPVLARSWTVSSWRLRRRRRTSWCWSTAWPMRIMCCVGTPGGARRGWGLAMIFDHDFGSSYINEPVNQPINSIQSIQFNQWIQSIIIKHTHTYIYIYLYIYIYIHINTHTYIYIHIHLCRP